MHPLTLLTSRNLTCVWWPGGCDRLLSHGRGSRPSLLPDCVVRRHPQPCNPITVPETQGEGVGVGAGARAGAYNLSCVRPPQIHGLRGRVVCGRRVVCGPRVVCGRGGRAQAVWLVATTPDWTRGPMLPPHACTCLVRFTAFLVECAAVTLTLSLTLSLASTLS